MLRRSERLFLSETRKVSTVKTSVIFSSEDTTLPSKWAFLIGCETSNNHSLPPWFLPLFQPCLFKTLRSHCILQRLLRHVIQDFMHSVPAKLVSLQLQQSSLREDEGRIAKSQSGKKLTECLDSVYRAHLRGTTTRDQELSEAWRVKNYEKLLNSTVNIF